MEINEFVANFASLFDETDPSEIKADTLFHNLDEWSSLIGMSIIALAKTEYGKNVTGAELRACNTVADIYKLIASK